jgi:hypothetical protein
MTPRTAFLFLFLFLIAVVAGYAWRRAHRLAPTAATSSAVARLTAVPEPPYLAFRSLTLDDSYNHVVLAALSSLGRRFVTPMACVRFHMAAGQGICLDAQDQGLSMRYFAYVFDERFRRGVEFPLTGIPSRARVSPDGSRAAVTVFEGGHSYADDMFSTRTTLFDLRQGRVIGELEQFAVERDGRPFKSIDFNFWGVTFARDSDHYYATLSSAGVYYLVEGWIGQRRMTVLRAGVECPSLSPDGRRLVFKSRRTAGGGPFWDLHVLDLTTMRETALAKEQRSIDDQVEWLDTDRIVYQLAGENGGEIWSLRTDGSSAPARLLANAYSPAMVQRTSR